MKNKEKEAGDGPFFKKTNKFSDHIKRRITVTQMDCTYLGRKKYIRVLDDAGVQTLPTCA